MKNLTALILAAGVGKRFWPFKNKVLFPFFGKPAYRHTVGGALPREISRVVVVVNQETKPVFDSFEFPVPHKIVFQKGARGMADAVLSAAEEIGNNPIQLYIADDFVDASIYQRVLQKVKGDEIFGVLPGMITKTYFPGGYLTMKGNRVIGIEEKPEENNVPSNYVYISGAYIANASLLVGEIKEIQSNADDIFEQAFTRLLSSHTVIVEPYEGDMVSLKYPWHVLDAMALLLGQIKNHKGKNVSIQPNVFIGGDVFIDDNVKIFEGTKIIGPCYIGPNTIIGNNNLIRESHIGSGCVTGFNTDITRSYIGNECWFHSNYIGDSVLGSHISLGGGTKLANLRLDEDDIVPHRNKLGAMIGDDVHVGINTSIMPGIKIGRNSLVGAGILLDQDLPDESFCVGKSQLVIKKNTRSVVEKSRDDFRQKLKKYV